MSSRRLTFRLNDTCGWMGNDPPHPSFGHPPQIRLKFVEFGEGLWSCLYCKFNACNFPPKARYHKFKRQTSSGSKSMTPFPAADSDEASCVVVSCSRYPDLRRRLILAVR